MKRTTLVTILGFVLLPVPSMAQESATGTTPNSPESGNAMDTITVVGTRTERALSEVAATISVTTAEEMERELVRDIADLVRFEPGVSVAGTGSRFGADGFTIRGIGGNRVLTLVDGVRVPDEFSFGPFLSSRRDFVDVDSLKRAEIARGPISSLYGSDALGGVVALTTKGPRDYLEEGSPFSAGFKLGYSGADESTVGTIMLASGNERVAGMLLYTRREGSETENNGSIGGTGRDRELPDPQSIESDNIVAKLSFAASEGHEFTLGFDFFNNNSDTRILSDYGVVSRGTTTDRRDAEDERTRTRFSLAYHYEGDLVIADSLQATVYQQSSDSEQATFEDRTTGSGQQQERQRVSSFDQDIQGAFFQLTKFLEAGGTSHLLSYGADFYKTESAGLRDGSTVDATTGADFESFPFPTRDFPLTEVEQFAVFLQDEITLLNGRLLLSPGVRFDSFDANATADDIYTSGNPGIALPEDFNDSEVTGKIGVVYSFTDKFSAYASYSEGFRAPPYDDVNVGFTNFAGGYKTISNPNLKSERSTGIEVGVRMVGEVGSVSLAAFRNDYEDFIESFAIAPEFLPSGGIDPADGLLTFQSINRAEVEINGIELSAETGFAAFSEALSGVSLRFSLAYADGEDTEAGEPLNSIEPLSGVLGLSYTAANDRWGADLIWTLVDGKDDSDIDANNPRLATPGYGVIDLLAHVSLSERVRLNIGIFNLGDKSYIRWNDTAGIGRDTPLRFTQPGFNAGATIRIDL